MNPKNVKYIILLTLIALTWFLNYWGNSSDNRIICFEEEEEKAKSLKNEKRNPTLNQPQTIYVLYAETMLKE